MFRTALAVGSAIVAGCVIGGCKDQTSSSSQAVPPSVTTPANNGADAAAAGAKDAGSNDDQAKIASLFTKIQQELKDLKIDDARSDIKTLQGMNDKLSAQQQLDLQTLSTQTDAAHNATTMPAMPKMP